MKRRDFVAVLLGSAASVAERRALAEASTSGGASPSNLPLVGFLNSASPATYRFNADSFREGLAEAGFVARAEPQDRKAPWAGGLAEFFELRRRSDRMTGAA
jgi:hypothetical protein